MLLTITTTHRPATDLGFLLEKHPDRVHEFDVSGGRASVFYPTVSEEVCTVALLMDIDPIGLARRARGQYTDRALEAYVSDRPYVASSLLSVALGKVFRSALAGRSRHRPALAATPIALEAKIAAMPMRGGEGLLRSLFEPLGYEVSITCLPLDEQFPAWGESVYSTMTLRGLATVQQLLQHLHVLIPVMDDNKHYWVGDDEIEKLHRHAATWLADHPQKEKIASRYLKHCRSLVREALHRLMVDERGQASESDPVAAETQLREQKIEETIRLHQVRLDSVFNVLEQLNVKRLLDLGCGEGRLLSALLKAKQFEQLVGLDVSVRALESARDRLLSERVPPLLRQRIQLWHGSLIYRDERLQGFDAITVIEVIEHLDLERLASFERVLFEYARPQSVIVTTPNREYNPRFENLQAGQFRHVDHRFEWTRVEFQTWCERQAVRFGYTVTYRAIGDEDPTLGAPTQMATFTMHWPTATAVDA